MRLHGAPPGIFALAVSADCIARRGNILRTVLRNADGSICAAGDGCPMLTQRRQAEPLIRLLFRPCLKNVKTPKRRIFFRQTALKILEIHKVFLRIFALSGGKISRRWALRQFSNKACKSVGYSHPFGAAAIGDEPIFLQLTVRQSFAQSAPPTHPHHAVRPR